MTDESKVVERELDRDIDLSVQVADPPVVGRLPGVIDPITEDFQRATEASVLEQGLRQLVAQLANTKIQHRLALAGALPAVQAPPGKQLGAAERGAHHPAQILKRLRLEEAQVEVAREMLREIRAAGKPAEVKTPSRLVVP